MALFFLSAFDDSQRYRRAATREEAMADFKAAWKH